MMSDMNLITLEDDFVEVKEVKKEKRVSDVIIDLSSDNQIIDLSSDNDSDDECQVEEIVFKEDEDVSFEKRVLKSRVTIFPRRRPKAYHTSELPQTLYPTAEEVKPQTLYPTAEEAKPQTLYPTAEEAKPQTLYPTAEEVKSQTLYLTAEEAKPKTLYLTAEEVKLQTLYPTAEEAKPQTLYPTSEELKVQPLKTLNQINDYKHKRKTDIDKVETYSCSWNNCTKIFYDSLLHYKHEKKHLRESKRKGLKTFNCLRCDFSAFTLTELIFHNTEHKGDYLCRFPNCFYKTDTKEKLNCHNLRHTSGKCSDCRRLSLCDCGEKCCL